MFGDSIFVSRFDLDKFRRIHINKSLYIYFERTKHVAVAFTEENKRINKKRREITEIVREWKIGWNSFDEHGQSDLQQII